MISSGEALSTFKGVGRRFSVWGETKSLKGEKFLVVDDYGHHPTEMAATIAAARGAYPDRRLLVAFQPHRYTRTRDCFEDLVRVLSNADALVLEAVYPAGEEKIFGADSRSLCRSIRLTGKVEPLFAGNTDEVMELINNNVKDGDVVLVMGAGNIGEVPAKLMKQGK